jgi:maltooligosyltrehalose trehalohydrolase
MSSPGDGPHALRRFSVWAPGHEHVELLVGTDRLPMSPAGRGWWAVEAPGVTGTAYAFSVDGGDPRPDPRARRLRDGVHGWSVVFDPDEFGWSDGDWHGTDLAGAVVYELHVGTFTPAGTLDAAVERLDHLVALGIDLVELMPVAAFPGRHGWGYDGVALYAVHEPYGGPAALQRFVDACHVRGLGVCLDVVYNHLGPSGNYLREFGPYFTDRYSTPWGDAVNLDGAGSDGVREFVLDNARQWFVDFHLDALRLDAVHVLHDGRAQTLLEALSAQTDSLAEQVGRPLWLIAESDRNDPATVLPRASRPGHPGGVGLHAQWADDVHHALHVQLTGETDGYYSDFANQEALAKVLTTPFFHDGTWSSFRARHHGAPVDPAATPGWRFIASLQTHDQVGNRARGERISALASPGRVACGAALLLTGPYTPMLFMGEEWAASTPWQFFTDHQEPELVEAIREGRRAEFAAHGWGGRVPDPQHPDTIASSRLDWDELEAPEHARMLGWYAELLALRRARPDLRDPRLDRVEVVHDVAAQTVLVRRGAHRVLVNLSAQDRAFTLGDKDRALRVLAAWRDGAVLNPGGVVVLAAETACVLGPG